MPSLEKVEVGGLVFEDFTDFWVQSWDPGPESIDTSDIDNPVYDDTYFGIDYHRGPTWTFDVIVEGKTELEVMDRLDELKATWRNPEYTKKAGESVELFFTQAGRRRLVYGRPRRFSAPQAAITAKQGYAAVLLEFKLSDPLQYDGGGNQGWVTTRLDAVPAETRGLQAYLTEDGLTTEAGGERQGQLPVVTGHAPTPFRCTLYGPNLSPGFTIDGRRYKFNTELKDYHRLIIDSRTGTVLRNGSTNMIHTMDDPIPLKGVRLQPGKAVEVTFFGDDPTLTSYAYFAFRPAHY